MDAVCTPTNRTWQVHPAVTVEEDVEIDHARAEPATTV